MKAKFYRWLFASPSRSFARPVELVCLRLQYQEKHLPLVVHIACQTLRLASRAEIDVRALQTANRAAGILIERKTCHWPPARQSTRAIDHGDFCLNQRERALGKQPRVRCDRT